MGLKSIRDIVDIGSKGASDTDTGSLNTVYTEFINIVIPNNLNKWKEEVLPLCFNSSFYILFI